MGLNSWKWCFNGAAYVESDPEVKLGSYVNLFTSLHLHVIAFFPGQQLKDLPKFLSVP